MKKHLIKANFSKQSIIATALSLWFVTGSNLPTVAASVDSSTVVPSAAPAAPQNSEAATYQNDVVMRAMKDELDRSMKSLKLPNYPLPYFGSCTVTDEEFARISASFGALSIKDVSRDRHSDFTLRVGDKQLDNTTAGGGGLRALLGLQSRLVQEDNYDAIRRDLWTQADRSYKQAIESLTSARAQMNYVDVEDKPDAFSDAPAIVSVKSDAHLTANIDEWAGRVKALSAIFKEYKNIKDSTVYMNIRARTTRLINSEGTIVKYGETGTLIFFGASSQNKDGMTVSDGDFLAGETEVSLPSQAEMEKIVRKLCDRVGALVVAQRAQEYSGPVLFEKEAAAELLSSMLPALVCARHEMGNVGADEIHKLNKPILGSSITVIDDPTQKEYKGKFLKSGWNIDYEGVAAKRLTLIDKGILKTLCSTRTPNRVVKVSNGHNRGGMASPGHLFVSSDAGTSFNALRQKLIEAGKKEGLDHVLIVRRIRPSFSAGGQIVDVERFNGSSMSLNQVYKVDVKTGSEQLLRGARLKTISKKNLLTMQAASDDADVYIVNYPTDNSSTTIGMVTPSVLLADVDFAKPLHTTEKPPYLENPYFEGQATKAK